ncbi:hypothetical protein [Spirosoma luteolum]
MPVTPDGTISDDIKVRMTGASVGPFSGDVVISQGTISTKVALSGQVNAPAQVLTVTPNSLAGFVTTLGTPSAAQSYALTGSNLQYNVNIFAPSGYELSLSESGTYAVNLLVERVGGMVEKTIWVRLSGQTLGEKTGNVSHRLSPGDDPVFLSVTGQVNAPAPVLTMTPGTLAGFETKYGTPSTPQTFQIKGSNFTPNTSLTLKAPAGFELSRLGNTYKASPSVTVKADGTIDQTVYVRLTGAQSGLFEGPITLADAQGKQQQANVLVFGATGSLGFDGPASINLSTIKGKPSAVTIYAVLGNGLTKPVVVTAPAGVQVSLTGDAGSFGNTVSIEPNQIGSVDVSVNVRLSGETVGPISGNITHVSGATSGNVAVTGEVKPAGPLVLTGAQLLSCASVTASQRLVSFVPQYSGSDETPISFEVVNELGATTVAGPYALKLYTDNPTITLRATQSGKTTTYAFNWLASCGTTPAPTPTPTPNPNPTPNPTPTPTPGPAVLFGIGGVQPVSCEVISGGERKVSLLPQYVGTDGTSISFAVVNEMAATTAPGPYTLKLYTDNPTITLRATQNGQTATLNYNWLAGCMNPAPTPTPTPTPTPNPTPTPTPTPTPVAFGITGVQTQCSGQEGGARQVTFTPQYSATDGTSISFAVVNEMAATTAPGPYTLKLYTDNPIVTLRATQSGQTVNFTYNWLGACLNVSKRVGVAESREPLAVQVLGNPVVGNTVRAEVRGAAGQALELELLDSRGQVIDRQRTVSAGVVETASFEVGRQAAGMLLLRARTAQQVQTVKVLKAD